MASKSTFPLLKPRDIVAVLKQLDIPLSLQELKEPTAAKMKEVYERFMDHLMGISKEELRQPQFSALHVLEFPELHEQSLPELMVAKTILRLLVLCGCHDCTLKNLIEPTYQRTRKNLSALVNFAKFRESRLECYQTFSGQTDELMEIKQTLDEEKARWLAQLQQLKAQREERAPQVAELKEKNSLLEHEIDEENKKEAELSNELESVRQEAEKTSQGLESERGVLEELRMENKKLHSQVVRSPEKLQRSIATMTEQTGQAKEEVSDLTKKLRNAQERRAGADKTSNKLKKRMAQIQQVKDDLTKQREHQSEIRGARAFLEESDKRVKEMIAQEEYMKKALSASQDKLYRLQRQFEQKKHTAQIALNQVSANRDSLLKDLEKERKLVEEHQRIHEIRKREIITLQNDHQKEMRALTNKFQAFQKQVDRYHRRMEAAFTAPLHSI